MYSVSKLHRATTALQYTLTRQMVCISCLTYYSHVSEVQITVASTHAYNFPKPGPSRQRPCFDPMPQLIKAHSTGIPQNFSSVTLSSISKAHLSLCPTISHFPLFPFILLLLWLSSFLFSPPCYFFSLSLSQHLSSLSIPLCLFCFTNKPQFLQY